MKKSTKIITITLTIAIALGGLGYFGLRQFARSIYSQRTCEWANIDNIELHTEIDIPKIKKCDCVYKKEQSIKMARFDIDGINVDINSYIKTNNFKKLNSTADISFDDILNMETNVEELKNSPNLFYTKGSYNGETWQTLLENSTGRLWVTIKYKD